MTQRNCSDVSRREAIAGGVAIVIAPVIGAVPALATPEEMASELKKLIGQATLKQGRVKVSLPELTENGNSTSLAISIDSPMTAADHVRALHIFAEKNPVPYIARFRIGPKAGKAQVATSIRVADSQTITVVAEMSDGSFWSGQGATEVTTPACIDDSDKPK